MKLKRFLLRYYPPGVILEYELRDKTRELKEIDLLHLTPDTDIDVIVNQIVFEEPLISESKKPHLRRLIYSRSMRPPPLLVHCSSADQYVVSATATPFDLFYCPPQN